MIIYNVAEKLLQRIFLIYARPFLSAYILTSNFNTFEKNYSLKSLVGDCILRSNLKHIELTSIKDISIALGYVMLHGKHIIIMYTDIDRDMLQASKPLLN